MEKNLVHATELNGLWRFHPGDDSKWAEAGFDDSQWPLIRPGTSGPQQVYNDSSGFSWYRIRVILPAQREPLAFYLPRVVSNCQVFANGILMGEVGRMPPHPRIVIASRVLFEIPGSSISPGGPLVIAIRMWRPPRLSPLPGAELVAPPVIGEASLMKYWQTLQIHHAYWAASDTGLNFIFNVLTAVAGLALFALRRKEREYLWFGAAQILWSMQALLFFLPIFKPISYVFALIFMVCTKAGAQFLNLEFFVTLMRQRKGTLYWVAVASVVIPLLALAPLAMGLMTGGTATLVATIVDLVYGICVPALLYRGASKGNFEAQLLLVPFTLSFALNVAGNLLVLPGVASLPLANTISYWLHNIVNQPFPMSAFNIAGDLAMFSVIAVLVLRYARSRRDEERLESELEAARAVQHVLIPDELPAVPGYQLECVYKPAGQVGGDFFQILPLPQGGALVAIGDVSGKGMPAAMTVSLLVGMMRMLARSVQSPAVILAVMNQNLMERMAGGFATCLILHIAPDGAVTAANAGHLAPYVNGNELAVANGLPLALSPAAAYAETEFRLSPEHQLTLLTDGVPEARRADGELFGFERAASISVRPAAEIAQAAEQFGQEDDITVLSITRRSSAHRPATVVEPPTWTAAPA